MADTTSNIGRWLEGFVGSQGGVAGSVHRRRDDDVLELVAAYNLPPEVQRVTAEVIRGKGMAGLALERDRPVSTCNLQTDASGDVRPGARAVAAQAAVALPVHDGAGRVRAVVGIAWLGERELSEVDLARLSEAACALPA